jgi:hypothetical protein
MTKTVRSLGWVKGGGSLSRYDRRLLRCGISTPLVTAWGLGCAETISLSGITGQCLGGLEIDSQSHPQAGRFNSITRKGSSVSIALAFC